MGPCHRPRGQYHPVRGQQRQRVANRPVNGGQHGAKLRGGFRRFDEWGGPNPVGPTRRNTTRISRHPAVTTSNVTFLAASGDLGRASARAIIRRFRPTSWPSVARPLSVNNDGTWNSEIGWSSSGGGNKRRGKRGQAIRQSVLTSGYRETPDVSIERQQPGRLGLFRRRTRMDWITGTSVGTPCWAGLIAIADQMRVAKGVTTLDGRSQTLRPSTRCRQRTSTTLSAETTGTRPAPVTTW